MLKHTLDYLKSNEKSLKINHKLTFYLSLHYYEKGNIEMFFKLS